MKDGFGSIANLLCKPYWLLLERSSAVTLVLLGGNLNNSGVALVAKVILLSVAVAQDSHYLSVIRDRGSSHEGSGKKGGETGNAEELHDDRVAGLASWLGGVCRCECMRACEFLYWW